MKEFTNEDYIRMKENGRKIFKDQIHESNIKK